MAFTNFVYLVVIVLSTVGKYESSFAGFKSFDKEKLTGPVPTDPDVFRNVSQLIVSKGYPVEEHHVLTPDAYILSVQRIRHGREKTVDAGRQKPVVLLQHGLLADSTCWVNSFPQNSLGFVLADSGYDVWLSNSRGNRYCRKNKRFSPLSPRFWEWSFDSMAKYDIPSTIEYILKATGEEQLYYIGHSQGALIGFGSFSRHPELAKKVKLFLALAPVVTLGNIEVEFLRVLSDATAAIKSVTPEIDSSFLPGKYWRKAIEMGFCDGFTEEKLCYKIFEYLVGEDNKNMNYSRIPVFLHSFPSGTSLRNLVHFAQLVVSGKCQMFDYGFIGNLVHYGKCEPPEYPIEDIETPIGIIAGRHDPLSNPKDVELLIPRIQNLAYNGTIETWNHIDFVWGNDANEFLYPTILRLIRKYL